MMRRSTVTFLAMAALLPLASAAAAFDPDTPLADPAKDSFPIRLDDQPDLTVRSAFFIGFGAAKRAGEDAVIVRDVGGTAYEFTPAALHVMDDGRAILLSTGGNPDASSASSGINAIHYLRSSPSGWVRLGEWFDVGGTGTMGNAATSWAFTARLGKNPYLISAGGGVWQGCLLNIAVVTEMTPNGPVDRGSFTAAMSSGAGIGQDDAEYDGQIISAKPDHSFVVGYTGTKAQRQNYVLRDGKYQLVGRDHIPGC